MKLLVGATLNSTINDDEGFQDVHLCKKVIFILYVGLLDGSMLEPSSRKASYGSDSSDGTAQTNQVLTKFNFIYSVSYILPNLQNWH